MVEKSMVRGGTLGLDAAVALVLSVFCLRAHDFLTGAAHIFPKQISIWDASFGVMFLFTWQYCFATLNLYSIFPTALRRVIATLKAALLMTLLVLVHVHLFHHSVSWKTAASLLIVLFYYELGRFTLSSYVLDRLAARDPRRAIIIGSGRRASKAWRGIRTRYHNSISMLGFVDNRDPSDMAPEVAHRFLGTVDNLNDLLLNQVVDVILIAMPIRSCYPLMQQAVHIAEAAGVQVVYLGDIYSSRSSSTADQDIFRELAPQQQSYLHRLIIKRITDICGAIFGLVFLSPLMFCIAIAIKSTSRGAVLFRQERYGHHRRVFSIVKFRTMVEDAEQRLAELEHRNEVQGPIFKMRNDPRVTKVGRFLRRTSLDELPQLWNVLIGEMSLVGPRPMSVRDVSLFDNATLMRRFSVTPGMTGLWQVNGRSEVSFDQWVALDCRYIDKWSLALDLKILVRTFNLMLKRSGAM